MKSWFKYGLLIVPWLFLAFVAAYFIFYGGWDDATAGRYHRKAHEVFSDTEGITSVKIYLLMGEDSEIQSDTFPIKPYGENYPTYGVVDLAGEDLTQFLGRWRYIEPSEGRQALCHDPVYGFRLYRDNDLAVETSICWECSNYYVTLRQGKSAWYGFNSDTGIAQALLDFCDARLPYRREDKDQGDETSDVQ